MKRFAIPSLLTLIVTLACQDTGVLTDTGMNSPDFLIYDGANDGDNEDFWFLPPVVSNPVGNPEFEPEEFNPNLKPTVRICVRDYESANWSCPAPGYVEGQADLEEGHYHFNWKTKKTDDDIYRVEVLLGTLRLGFFDAEVSKKGKSAAEGNVPVKAGTNVPVKTAIETNAACFALNPSFNPDEDTCSTATLNGGQSLQLGNDANAKVNNGGTINMTFCENLRDRTSMTDGRVDIPTFGPCIEIENLEDFLVSGTATICEAYDLAVVQNGLSPTQAERMTVHRHGENDSTAAVALPHGDGATCTSQAFHIESRLERLALQFGESIWNALVTAGDHVLAFVGPQPLMACNRGGCGSPTEFESSYQVALPTLMEFHEYNPGGDLGDHLVGSKVTAKIRAWDSGELEDEAGLVPEPVDSVRLTVALAPGSPGTIVGPSTIYTDSAGIATFELMVGAGTNTVEVTGIGVGTDSVYGPSILDENASLVQLGVGTLTFTARSITLVGSSTVLAGDTLRLTPDSVYTVGAAWTQNKKTLDGGFTAAFSFRISDPDSALDGADGIAFVVQNQQFDAIGEVGGAMGYGGQTTPITPSLAVEFDTWQNGELFVKDSSGNHISVHLNGDLNEDNAVAHVLDPGGISLSDGLIHDVEIVFTAGTDQLTVSLDGNLVLTATVDLSTVLDVNGKAWVGFTSATGAAYEKHDVFNIDIDIP